MSEKLLPCPFCGGEARLIRLRGCLSAKCAGDFTECAGATDYVRVALWNRRTPAPEGEAVAWRLRRVGVVRWNLWDLDPRVDTPAYADAAEWEVQPLYASPVVPVGVSEVLDAAAAYLKDQYGASHGLDHPVDRARIIEALRPTDTGANHD